MLNDRQHLEALSREAAAEIYAEAEGVTPLQALRHLRDREVLSRRTRREFRDL